MRQHSADFILTRNLSESIRCPYCGAEEGRRCFDPRDGVEIECQPAHNIRMREAGAI